MGGRAAYDLLSTQPYLGWRDPMALRLYGRDNRLGLLWWLEATPRLGIPERAMSRSIARIVDAAQPWLDSGDEIEVRLGELRGVGRRQR